MSKMRKKGESGEAVKYINRNQALKKLQLSLPDFRRLCILKGVYPREPKNKKKVNKGSTANRTYYFTKDIQFLAHEPILQKFRDFKVFTRKLKRAYGREEYTDAERLEENKPVYTLDHIVKERYPTFVDALRDLDDALSMVFLFARLPQTDKIKYDFVKKCKRLSVEFQNYVILSKTLKKTFISIKGYYYQAEIQGQKITWIVPHHFTQQLPDDVDFRIMLTFIEFYMTLIGFVNFQLYHSINLHYPPKLTHTKEIEDNGTYCQDVDIEDERLASLTSSLQTIVSEATEEVKLDEFPAQEKDADGDESTAVKINEEIAKEEKFHTLFKDLKFFASREVPRDSLVFLIRCFGGDVSWDASVAINSTFQESDEHITHQIVDRPSLKPKNINRSYIQPQWIFDCINCKKILPVDEYVPGAILPPHLSPFVDDSEEYVPPERKQLLEENVDEKSEQENTQHALGKRKATNDDDNMTAEEKKLALMMLPKKKKALYDKIMHSKKKKATKIRNLEEKRRKIDNESSNADQKSKKKKKVS